MKILLMLCLLVLSPHVLAQNNALSDGKNFYVKTGSDYSQNFGISAQQLKPFDKKLQKEIPTLSVGVNSYSSPTETEGFSSFILKEQLKTLNQSTPFNVHHNATLERFIRVYLQDRNDYLNNVLGKSMYYFPFFEATLDNYDLPIELKYLAVVESALNQVATSPSGAKGLWQFMYGTGTDYQLYIDSFVDERYDLIKSTQAACAYLKNLHQLFGDWDLALAAYNSGPGNVRKAIRRAGGNTNYWEIRHFLPRETSSYVPAFYAIMYLFSHADYHGLNPAKGAVSYVATDTVQIKQSLTFEAITKKTGIDLQTLRSLNPVYKKDLIPIVRDKHMTLTLPSSLMSRFLDFESDLYDDTSPVERPKTASKVISITPYNSYLVVKGDNLQNIAQKHSISLSQLKTWNGLDSNFLITGQRLVVTDRKKHYLKNIKTKGNPTNEGQPFDQEKNQFTHYTVQHGDTLFKISRKFGNIPVSELRSTNMLEDVNHLKPGTNLKIRKTTNAEQSSSVNNS